MNHLHYILHENQHLNKPSALPSVYKSCRVIKGEWMMMADNEQRMNRKNREAGREKGDFPLLFPEKCRTLHPESVDIDIRYMV